MQALFIFSAAAPPLHHPSPISHNRLALLPLHSHALAQTTQPITLQTTSQPPSLPLEALSLAQQASASVEHVDRPYPFSQLQESKLGEFVLVSFILLLLFWLGNYFVPDLIFRKVFHPDEGEDQNSKVNKDGILDSDVLGADRSDSDFVASSKATISMQAQGALKGDMSRNNKITGFGKAQKQNGRLKKGKV